MHDSLYLKLSCDRMQLRHLESGRGLERRASPPFSNARLLVADFIGAERLLKQALAELLPKRFFSLRPRLLIQPLERLEGGLSPVEERILLELGLGSGARKVRLHVGAELDDAVIRARLAN